jgi:cephalosporin-C deacetylase-like acetyl esterase
MRIHPFAAAAALAALVASFAIAHAQGPEPGSLPEQSRPPATAPAAANPRPAAAPLNRADPNSPAQAGRNALYKYLDDIAAKDEAAREAAIAKIATRDQAVLRQQEVRTKIQELLGGGFVRTPLNAQVLGSTQMDGFRIEKVVYESQPKFYVTALMYVPEGVKTTAGPSTPVGAGAPTSAQDDSSLGRKYPAVVMAPGHAASGKAGDYAMAATFARNGFVVLSYDPIGQGERLQYPDPATLSKGLAAGSLATRPTGEHGEAGLQPTLIGDTVARYFLWDGMRAVDYLISRPEVDAERIGAFGCSGGGAMTALLGAMDKRVKATATACYLTTMDTLLPSIGAQDAEQSIPGFIASGFDFADWVEQAAPRAYAMVGTVSDMFPWKGFLQTATEARRFYSLFDASAAGVSATDNRRFLRQAQDRLFDSGRGATSAQDDRSVGGGAKADSGDGGQRSAVSDQLPTPTGPTLNPDTANAVPASSPFQVIAGIGGHGNLRPITSQIVGFFLVHLAGRSADTFVAPPAAAAAASPFAAPDVPAGALQVTATGQVASSYPGSETVFSLNLKRAAGKIPQFVAPQTLLQVQTDVREVTKADAVPGGPPSGFKFPFPDYAAHPGPRDRIPAVLLVRGDESSSPENPIDPIDDDMKALAAAGNFVLSFVPTPSSSGGEETKSPILGPFYLTELREELVGKTLLGMRVDDVIHAVDYLAARRDIDASNITVVVSGHMGLVALHAAVLDKRIKHVTVDHVLESYASLLRAPMPLDAPQDILPSVLLKYDIPDLVRVLGPRVTATNWLSSQRASSPGVPTLPGTANLAEK